jgi:hypothetical protein
LFSCEKVVNDGALAIYIVLTGSTSSASLKGPSDYANPIGTTARKHWAMNGFREVVKVRP